MSDNNQLSTSTPFHTPRESSLLGRRNCNLAMIADRALNHEPDFHKIADFIREIDPKIKTLVIGKRSQGVVKLAPLLARPTFGFSPVPLNKFHLLRGKLLTGQRLTKSQEYEVLDAAGFPVPKWKLINEGEDPDFSDFSPYVVSKPDTGMRGANVKIKRKSRMQPKAKPQESVERLTTAVPEGRKTRTGYHINETRMLAQEFVYTGLWPVSYRVTTLFGQVIHSIRVEANQERKQLAGPEAFGKAGEDGVSIVASGQGCTMTLNYDEEIIRLGETAHAAFPEIPLLGIDIIREVPSGKLYIVEVNASGYVWHFSSPMGTNLQREFNFSLESQFDGLRKAAYILAAKTQESAA